MDSDVTQLDLEQARAEIVRLRSGIRLHRDEKGHDRCWIDDQRLYELLPEQVKADLSLPPRDEFLENCSKFHQLRQPPKEGR